MDSWVGYDCMTFDILPPRPRLTVLIPAYRPGAYLREAVDSVLAQEGVDLELLVVDDASPESVAASLAGMDDARLRIYRNPVNLGLVGNWNRCLTLAEGDPVLIFHQDDRLMPGYLARATALMVADPSLAFVFSNVLRIDAAGQPSGGHWAPEALPATSRSVPGAEMIRLLLARGNFITCPSVVVRRSAYAAAGPFNSELGYTPDLEMWLRLGLLGRVAYVAEPGYEQRIHPDQESRHFRGGPAELAELRHAYRSFFALAEAAASPSRDSYRPSAADRRLLQGQLKRWTSWRLRRSLRSGRMLDALAFARGLVQLRLAAWRGEPC